MVYKYNQEVDSKIKIIFDKNDIELLDHFIDIMGGKDEFIKSLFSYELGARYSDFNIIQSLYALMYHKDILDLVVDEKHSDIINAIKTDGWVYTSIDYHEGCALKQAREARWIHDNR